MVTGSNPTQVTFVFVVSNTISEFPSHDIRYIIVKYMLWNISFVKKDAVIGTNLL
jgi:hypothetical protein